ncbi:hypothetical protein EMPS_03445 [Entomortierella parvispora]|uniref:Uncharacterized protein n=1 Tax=Entomortierella parvispora TaxID=205924 RepID=A0A9P3LUW3_9FUNG|nr:hypothetical protein EMPS_03445 [Entomortierella parvispora]
MTIMMPPSPATSISSQSYRGHHSRNSSESLLFTPPLSPTEEQLLAFLIPDIEPSELAAYLSAPSTPLMSDVSCLIGKNTIKQAQAPSFYSTLLEAETVYPSPVCAAAAATVVALDRLDSHDVQPMVSHDVFSAPALRKSNKRCSTFAFMDADHDQETKEMDEASSDDFSASPVYVMSSRNTRKRLMLEQAFVSPEDNEESHQNCYAQLFQGATSEDETTDLSQDLSETLAFDLILV